MKYKYINPETKESITREYPMADCPSSVVVDGVEYKRDFISDLSGSKTSIIIPQHMKAGNY